MMTGASTAVHDLIEMDEEAASLRHDVLITLVECHRDQTLEGFREAVPPQVINALASAIAVRLGPRIGGRYVPKGAWRAGSEDRAMRDAAVAMAYTGDNREEVMRRFGISRRLLYSILARERRKNAR